MKVDIALNKMSLRITKDGGDYIDLDIPNDAGFKQLRKFWEGEDDNN